MAAIQTSTESSSLAEVVSIILDKGVVIDLWAKVSLVGIQILAVEARIVLASVETYLKYAAAVGLTPGIATPVPALQAPSPATMGVPTGATVAVGA
jgi:hypothetical protein